MGTETEDKKVKRKKINDADKKRLSVMKKRKMKKQAEGATAVAALAAGIKKKRLQKKTSQLNTRKLKQKKNKKSSGKQSGPKPIVSTKKSTQKALDIPAKKTLESSRLEKDDEEIDLEDMIFGGFTARATPLVKVVKKKPENAFQLAGTTSMEGTVPDDNELFVIDTNPQTVEEEEEEEKPLWDAPRGGPMQTSLEQEPKPLVPLWEDVDTQDFDVNIADGANRLRKLRESLDETMVDVKEYEARLRRQFEKLHPTPIWADPANAQAGTHSMSVVLRSTRSLIDKSLHKGVKLVQEGINMLRVRDANYVAPSEAVVQTCKFHPSAPVLLTAGLDKTLRLFNIDGRHNVKLQSVYFKDLPIHSADFTVDGRQVVVSGRRNFFFSYDIEAGAVEKVHGIRGREEKSFEKFKISPCGQFIAFKGRDGYIILVSRLTKQWVGDLRMNGSVNDFDFSKDGKFLYSVGNDGIVYQWDVAARQCVHRFHDEGAMNPTTIAVSPDNSFIATGSSAGVVNVYSSSSALEMPKPTPTKSLMNLTTNIHTLSFHPSSQALLFASHSKKDQMRLAHLPSLGVFANWPTANTPLSYATCVDWSPGGGYLAIGNDKGRTLLYRALDFDPY